MPRHEWYQSREEVNITVFVVDADKKDISVSISRDSVTVSIPESEYTQTFALYSSIDEQQSTFSIKRRKVEITLHKIAKNNEWTSLEREEQEVPDRPGKPWTSTHNWDEVAKSIDEETEKEKPEGDAALMKLFQDIYAKSDENTKKAMMKSYQESGGTVLSTNWSEVKQKNVDVQPPDGMAAKKWEK